MVTINLIDSKRKPLGSLVTDKPIKVAALKEHIATKYHIPKNRQRLLTWSNGAQWHVLEDNKAIGGPSTSSSPSSGQVGSKTEEEGSITLLVKDLGVQIGWRTVFLLEYLGPILIHLYYALRVNNWSRLVPLQRVFLLSILVHYLKREYETVLVHRFSHDTMPIFNLFKNCAHYWALGGWFIARHIYEPGYATGGLLTGYKSKLYPVQWLYFALFLVFEGCNFYTHLVLRGLRPAGTSKRAIPYGLGFSPPPLPRLPQLLFRGPRLDLLHPDDPHLEQPPLHHRRHCANVGLGPKEARQVH